MDALLLVGGGGHCRAVIDVVEREGRWAIAGIVDPGLPEGSAVLGYPVLGGDDALEHLRGTAADHALVTLGQIRSAAGRSRLYGRLAGLGFRLATVVSPRALVSRHAALGPGTVAMHFVAVGPGAAVGCNAILNTRSLVEHDARVGDHCHVSTGAVLNGGVRLGDGSFVGSNSVLREGVSVAPGTFIPMGSRVVRDLPGTTVEEARP